MWTYLLQMRRSTPASHTQKFCMSEDPATLRVGWSEQGLPRTMPLEPTTAVRTVLKVSLNKSNQLNL